MVFGISQTIKMRMVGTSKAFIRKNYSFLRLAGVTMIMDISKGQILTTVGQQGVKCLKQKLLYLTFTFVISGPDPNKPCVFPFQYYGAEYNKCITSRLGVVGSVEVSKNISEN